MKYLIIHTLVPTMFAAFLSGCVSTSLQTAANALVSGNCSQCQKDHYEYSGPYQFAIASHGVQK
jgi:hypothetical protein